MILYVHRPFGELLLSLFTSNSSSHGLAEAFHSPGRWEVTCIVLPVRMLHLLDTHLTFPKLYKMMSSLRFLTNCQGKIFL